MKKFAKWLDNYWYHYKWHTIITLFFVVVLTICIVQMASKEKTDINIIYAGPAYLDVDSVHSVQSAFEQIMKEDYDGDGKKTVKLTNLIIMSDEQAAEQERLAALEEMDFYYNTSTRNSTYSQIQTYVSSGEMTICLFDQYIYDSLNEQNAFVPLAELFGEKPEYARDECSVYFKDTPFGDYYDAFDIIPDDTILCVRKMPEISVVKNNKNMREKYNNSLDMFKRIFEFAVE